MSEDTTTTDAPDAEVNADNGDITPPEAKKWWKFNDQDDAVAWVNEKVQKRLAREKAKYDPIIAERDILKTRVEELEPLEKATQTDTQRWESERTFLTTELEELRQFRTQQERNNLVRELADEKGLPTRFISRVHGDDAESITADIDDLMTVINDGKPTKPASRKPVDPEEEPGSKGYGGGGSKTDTDDKAVVANVVKKFRENRHNTFTR